MRPKNTTGCAGAVAAPGWLCWISLVALIVACAPVKTKPQVETLLNQFESKNLSPAQLHEAVEELGRLPTHEPGGYWVRILKDSTYSDEHRRQALFLFLRRHVQPRVPFPLQHFSTFEHFNGLFTSSNLVTATAWNVVPVKRSAGGLYYFQPSYLKPSSSSVWFSTSKNLYEHEFIELAEGASYTNALIVDMVIQDESAGRLPVASPKN